MRRLADAEHLDGDLSDRTTLDGNLRDLARINRRFGGTRLSIDGVRRLAEGEALRGAPVAAGGAPVAAGGAPTAARSAPPVFRVLDVGTGGADIPLALARAAGPWHQMHVTALDSRPEILDAARRVAPELARTPEVELGVGDGRSLPYPDGSFDVAHASLVLHHLSGDDAVTFLVELARVARVGVVVNDLARSRVNWLGAWLVLHALTRNAWTRHDGVLSVRRGWTLDEARELLRDAGLRPVHTGIAIAGHRWAIAAVHE